MFINGEWQTARQHFLCSTRYGRRVDWWRTQAPMTRAVLSMRHMRPPRMNKPPIHAPRYSIVHTC